MRICLEIAENRLLASQSIESGEVDRLFGKRAMVHSDSADLSTILQEKKEGKYIKKVQEKTGEQDEMLLTGKISYPRLSQSKRHPDEAKRPT